MATTRISRYSDDSSSFTGTTSSSSTVLGPGAITGKFLKILGEKSLDIVVYVIIRNRLRGIKNILEKSPHILRNPSGEKEERRMFHAYNDLSELCLPGPGEIRYDYSLSFQKAAANLIQEITLITRPQAVTPDISIPASHSNEKWEALLDHVQHLLQPQTPPETNEDLHGDLPRPRVLIREVLSRPPKPTSQGLRDQTRNVLILGIGEVGKSTLVKQIQGSDRVTHDDETYRDVIIRDTMMSVLQIVSDLDPSDLSEDCRTTFRQAKDACQKNFDSWDPSRYPFGGAIELLWNELAVRRAVLRARLGISMYPGYGPGFEYMDYLFDSAYRIFQPDYKPTHEDIIRCHIRTTGIWRTKVTMGNAPWHVIDTGGERSERKKWIHCFEGVTAVIFMVALSDYNKCPKEYLPVNRMEESLCLFESIVNTHWLTNSLVVLLFNKVDLFVEKLSHVPLANYFPDYTGEGPDDACQYFEHRFLGLARDKSRVVVKYGSAVDVEETHVNLQSITEEINLHYEQNMGIL